MKKEQNPKFDEGFDFGLLTFRLSTPPYTFQNSHLAPIQRFNSSLVLTLSQNILYDIHIYGRSGWLMDDW